LVSVLSRGLARCIDDPLEQIAEKKQNNEADNPQYSNSTTSSYQIVRCIRKYEKESEVTELKRPRNVRPTTTVFLDPPSEKHEKDKVPYNSKMSTHLVSQVVEKSLISANHDGKSDEND
jgi:hypothetical protein